MVSNLLNRIIGADSTYNCILSMHSDYMLRFIVEHTV